MSLLPRLRSVRNRIIGRLEVDWYVARGLQVGQRVWVGAGTQLDTDHCHLVTLEDDVTLASQVIILAHDASTKQHLGYTAIAPVTIKARAFVGARSTILPGVTIGEDSIIGAGSLVTRDVPPRSVAIGAPARVVSTLDEFLARHREQMKARPTYDESWTNRAGVSSDLKLQMRREVINSAGGYVE